jgi:hypothetical protein
MTSIFSAYLDVVLRFLIVLLSIAVAGQPIPVIDGLQVQPVISSGKTKLFAVTRDTVRPWHRLSPRLKLDVSPGPAIYPTRTERCLHRDHFLWKRTWYDHTARILRPSVARVPNVVGVVLQLNDHLVAARIYNHSQHLRRHLYHTLRDWYCATATQGKNITGPTLPTEVVAEWLRERIAEENAVQKTY